MTGIIAGEEYDTDKSVKLGEHKYSDHGNIAWINEALYQKTNGKYFLAGAGGPCTKYAWRTDGIVSSGNRIIPMTVEKAKQWAEKHMTPKQRMEAFNVR